MSMEISREKRIWIEESKRQQQLKRLAKEPCERQKFKKHILRNLDKVSPDKPNFRDLCADFKMSDSEGRKIYYEISMKLTSASIRMGTVNEARVKGDRGNV